MMPLLQVQVLLQQLTALPAKGLMRDACTALLARPVADDVAGQLSAALQQLQLEGERCCGHACIAMVNVLVS
jgi:hypothetical protein